MNNHTQIKRKDYLIIHAITSKAILLIRRWYWAWVSNYIPHGSTGVITYPCPYYLIGVSKRGPWIFLQISQPWRRYRMETLSSLLALCAGKSPAIGKFASQRPVTWSFGVFFDLRLNQWLSKQLRCRWLETSSRSLWGYFNCNRQPIWNHIRKGCYLTRILILMF